jgi:hypothetical protein
MRQDEKIYSIDEHFECWNLRKFSASEFIDAIKLKIPPVNDNVLRNYLNNDTNQLIAKELAVTSVTSPGFEAMFPNIPPNELQQLFETLFLDVKWIDTYRRGYLISTYTKTTVNANWKFINTVDTMYYSESKPSHEEIILYN